MFDDASAIVDNPSIHRLSRATLLPPPDEGQTVGGRPVVNLTLALNYALNFKPVPELLAEARGKAQTDGHR